ncbi:MAG TPA: DUF5916 domain-containing protein [Chitinophagaceae bacterium]|jgi:hypothetical protein|nr:DUF5916 domain-containing protein [Chitinophagaceae bacterium]
MKIIFAILYVAVFPPMCAFAQGFPQTNAVRTHLPVKIDGVLDDEAWKEAPLITGLIERRPNPGRSETAGNRSELRLLYDNNAVYFAGMLYETDKDSISRQLGGRDNLGTSDYIGVIFDTYLDKNNGAGFYVTPLNEQIDIKFGIGLNNGQDLSWNTVYTSAVKLHSDGWSFEMRIPYSALRFSKSKIQDWGLQVSRQRIKSGQQFFWSSIDPNKFGFMNQAGTWKGLLDIQPPLRLSFSPYLSTYVTRNPSLGNKWKTSITGGMDVKYGITDGFTMDMTLIPDFGQVQSDNQVLNLSPFEVRFNENRPFFTEGLELFNKGNLFYSRRIGGQPIHYYDVYDRIGANETVIKNPVENKLINATKVSGRTKKKLGLGFFNAITKAQYATINDGTGKTYKLETDPLTNYSILVADQGLKNNSRVTVINTNVMRSGKDYDANVSSLDWDLYDNKINWNFWGQVNHSRLSGYKVPGKTTAGNLVNLFIGQFKGRLNWEVDFLHADDKYQHSDMGYFTNNNYRTYGSYIGYKWLKPKSFYNNMYLNLTLNYSQLYKPRRYQDYKITGNLNGQLKNLWNFVINFDIRPKSNDFYESRVGGFAFQRPANWMKGFTISTNYAKKYATKIQLFQRTAQQYHTSNLEMFVSNTYRFSDKFNAELSHYMFFGNNDYGFAYYTDDRDSVATGLRTRRTAENILNLIYNFNNRMGLSFRLRHYWSKAGYNRMFNLRKDGSVESLPVAVKNSDVNLNLFNIDINYSWQVAPGSFVNVNWKTSSDLSNQLVMERYYDNLKRVIDIPQFNSFSVKLIYYIDYLDLKRKKNKK